jgi:predicted kinase
MATLYLTCGLPASGKTTLARELEARGALRLTADEWLWEILPEGTRPEHDALRPAVERLQWQTALRAVHLGIDAVIDWGIWTREERDIYREAARAAGIRVVLCVLDPPIEEIRRRLQVRNADRPAGVFFIEQADMERGEKYWQTPTEEELALYDGERE